MKQMAAVVILSGFVLFLPESSMTKVGLAYMQNLTKVLGQEATFSCVFDDLSSDKGIKWVREGIVDKFGTGEPPVVVITEDIVRQSKYRITVTQESQHESTIRIKNLMEEDAGKYICKTPSQQAQSAYLRVQVPAQIVDHSTSSGVIVKEHTTARLTCMATGVPVPVITWRREDNKTITVDDSTNVFEYVGHELRLSNADRHDMGNYLCLANNRVPPTSVKIVSLKIIFPPTLKVAQDIVKIGKGRNVTLPCTVEASPKALIVWRNKDRNLIQNKTGKYIIKEEYLDRYETTVRLSLTILDIEEEDFQTYRCEASNQSGEGEETIRLIRDGSDTRSRKKANSGTGRSSARADDITDASSPSSSSMSSSSASSRSGRNDGKRVPVGAETADAGGTVVAYVNNPSGSLPSRASVLSQLAEMLSVCFNLFVLAIFQHFLINL